MEEETVAEFYLEEFMKHLERLVNMDSGSSDIEGLNRAADYLCSCYQEIGLVPVRTALKPSGRPYIEVRTHPEQEEADVLFLGHIDTVFERGTAALRPFSVSEDGKRAYGPGAGDMKAGDLLAFYLTRALREARPDLRICVCYNSDEEIGSEESAPVMQKTASQCRYGFVFEPGRIGGHFVSQRKGAVDVAVRCSGIASHAGNAPQEGASAILEMADLIQKLCALNDFRSGMTVNAGVIRGGSASNVVAADCEAVFDVRYTSSDQLQDFENYLEDLAARPAVDRVQVTWEKRSQMPPVNPNQNTQAMIDLLQGEANKMGLHPQFLHVGGASDGSLLAEMGTAVMDGCGPESDKYHSAEEYLRVESIEERFHLLLSVISQLH